MNILWLDDDMELLDSSVSRFEEEGHVVQRAADLEGAVEALKTTDFDLLVLDMCMPPEPLFTKMETMGGGRTGVYFAQYVRFHFPKLPVVILSQFSVGEYDDMLLFGYGILSFSKNRFRGARITELLKELPELKPQPNAMDALELKPGAFGIKLDVRKFAEFIWSKTEGKKRREEWEKENSDPHKVKIRNLLRDGRR